MTTKEIARQVIDALPAKATLEDAMYALYVRIKLDEAEREIRQGRGIPHQVALKKLRKWLK